jgi:hypothetical protein
MESEMQPGVMRAQKREIQISRVSFMNRKSSCGYATHLFHLI